MMTKNFPQVNVRHQAADPRSSEDATQGKCENKTTGAVHRHIDCELQEIEEKRKPCKKTEGKVTLTTQKSKDENWSWLLSNAASEERGRECSELWSLPQASSTLHLVPLSL